MSGWIENYPYICSAVCCSENFVMAISALVLLLKEFIRQLNIKLGLYI